MSVRKFWLENAKHEIWNFTQEEANTFFEQPKGLGLDNKVGDYRLGDAIVVSGIQSELKDISGVLSFFGDTRADVYKGYYDFVNFIADNRLLKLHYQTPNSYDSYYRYVYVSSITKNEIDNDYLMLECPIVFGTQTFWRTDKKNVRIVTSNLNSDSKKYELHRPYAYSSNELSNITLINRGNKDSALKITINGTCTNPTISAFSNGEKYGEARLIGTFDKVVIDSDDLNEYIQLVKDGSILTAPFSYQDLSIGSANQIYVTFIKLKVGESVIRCNFDATFNGNVKLEWNDEYVSI